MTLIHHLEGSFLSAAAMATGFLLCAGCGDSSGGPTEDGGTGGELDTGGPQLPPPECEGRIYVGRVDGGTCGSHAGDQGSWIGTSLGDEGVLKSFCEYRWKALGEALPDQAALPGLAQGVSNLVESCPRVTPQGVFMDPELRKMIMAEFMANIGKPLLPMPLGPKPVAVRLIDTIPNGLFGGDIAPRSEHGLILHELSLDILCTNNDACRATVVDNLGMPRFNEQDEDYVRGGDSGTLANLARGLNEGIDQWEKDGAGARQVFVLALGWEPLDEYGLSQLQGKSLPEILDDSEIPADLQYVLASLARASCRGALTVAAAGNSNTEPCLQSGPTGPGFLEALPAPTVAVCEKFGFDHSDTDLIDAHPLVLAAAHITPDGEAPGNARQGAQAPLAAQGTAFGSAEGTGNSLSGSSVATVVFGAAAAWVWSSFPALTPAQIRAILHDAGIPLGKTADFPDPSEEVRQISICRAMKAACVMSGGACDDFPSCSAPPGSVPGIDEHLATTIESLPITATFGPNFPSSGPAPSACGGETMLWPQTDLPPLPPKPPLPWTSPMPGKTACRRYCIGGITANGTGVKVGLEFPAAMPFSGPIFIELRTEATTYRFAIPLEMLDWSGPNVFQIIPPPEVKLGEVRAINLGYVLAGTDGSRQYRSEPLINFVDAGPVQTCEGMMDLCYDPSVSDAQKGVGACQAGVAECTENGWICTGAGVSTPEDCSTPDLDEDCDGETLPAQCECANGDAAPCAFPPDITWKAGKGICIETEQLCMDGQWEACTLNLPTEEDCATPLIDENCDGVVACGEGVMRLVAGDLHTCALTDDGGVRCWGVNNLGILGTGKGPFSEPVPPEATINLGAGKRAIDIRASIEHTCALLDSHDVMCWGEGIDGRLGYKNKDQVGLNNDPAAAGTVDVGGKVSKLTVGWKHTCALRMDGQVLCWGYGSDGRLGRGNTATIGDDETPASAGPLKLPAGIVDLVAGGSHTCVLLDTGGVKCWGDGSAGQLGYGNTLDIGDVNGLADVPVGGTVVELTANLLHTCARLDSGLIRCWGDNTNGKLGYDPMNTIVGDNEKPESLPAIDLGAPALRITAGQDFTCARLVGDTAKCWGMNKDGQLGQGHTNPIIGDLANMPPIDFGNGVAVIDIVAGWRHACVRTSGSTGKCWGDGKSYQLGIGEPDQDALLVGDMPEEVAKVSVQFPWK